MRITIGPRTKTKPRLVKRLPMALSAAENAQMVWQWGDARHHIVIWRRRACVSVVDRSWCFHLASSYASLPLLISPRLCGGSHPFPPRWRINDSPSERSTSPNCKNVSLPSSHTICSQRSMATVSMPPAFSGPVSLCFVSPTPPSPGWLSPGLLPNRTTVGPPL